MKKFEFGEETARVLKQPLSREHVYQLQGNDYVESHHVIRTLSEAFGYAGWSFETKSVDCVFDGENARGKAQTVYVAEVRLLVKCPDGTVIYRDDAGSGDQTGGDAAKRHGNAVKGAISDAQKRAARSFGDQFGLALYAKQQVNVVDAGVAAVSDVDIPAQIEACQTVDALKQLHARLSLAQKKQFRDNVTARKEALG